MKPLFIIAILIISLPVIQNVSASQHLDLFDVPFLAPFKQFQNGIKSDSIQCNEQLELIYKINNMPACVRWHTADELIRRNWAHPTNDNIPVMQVPPKLTNNIPIIYPQNATFLNSLSYFPDFITLVIPTNNTVSWINHSDRTLDLLVSIEKYGAYSLLEEQKIISHGTTTFEKPGFYSFWISPHYQLGDGGSIIVLMEDMDSLDIQEKLSLAYGILEVYFIEKKIWGGPSGYEEGYLDLVFDKDTYDSSIFYEKFENEIKEVLPFEVPYKIRFDVVRASG